MTAPAKVEQRHRVDYTVSDSHEASALLSALRNMHCDRPHSIFGPPCERCLSTVHDALAKAICVIRAAGYAAGVKDEREAAVQRVVHRNVLGVDKGLHVLAAIMDEPVFMPERYAAIRARSDAQEVKP